MSWTVTLAGETFTEANVAGTAYADPVTGFPAILAAFVREAAFLRGLAATSATLLTPATGPVTLTTHQDAATVGLSPGTVVRVASAGDPGRLMVGTVTGFAGTALDLEVVFAAGDEAADWVIGRPLAAATSLAHDPAPALAADLDAAGHSLAGLLDLTVTALASLHRLRVGGGDEWAELDLGAAAVDQAVGPGTAPLLRVVLGADLALGHAAPTPGFGYWKEWTVLQDATGGRVPGFRDAAGEPGAWPLDDEPDWAAQSAGAETTVIAKMTPGGVLKLYRGG